LINYWRRVDYVSLIMRMEPNRLDDSWDLIIAWFILFEKQSSLNYLSSLHILNLSIRNLIASFLLAFDC
jgi:hypothetical protein